ncbi:hypothetical protein [Primorskyibacter sedentarius]|uniref:hypothetical protein n=1 Tax=Primorskyibacter sedentarius TaxID=745311 RepID=UPI003EB6E769
MPKRDPKTLRPLKSDKTGSYTPEPVKQTKTAAELGGSDLATQPMDNAQTLSDGQENLQAAGMPEDTPEDTAARSEAGTPAKTVSSKKPAGKKRSVPAAQEHTDVDEAPDFLADVEAFASYLQHQALRVVQISEKDGMHRTFYPDGRGGYFGLFILLLPGTGNPREKWTGPVPEWIRALRQACYMAEVCFGAGQAQDLIERYRQFDATPTVFRR